MSTDPEIRTASRSADWLYLPIYILIGAVIPYSGLNYFFLHSAEGKPPLIANLIVLVFCVLAGVGFFRWFSDRLFWRLTDSELIGGRRENLRLPLSSLEKIIIGLPIKFPIANMEKFAAPKTRNVAVFAKQSALLLCFSDDNILPLQLHFIPNGSDLMNGLVSRFPERVVQSYKYSEQEIKILQKADVNVLIKGVRIANNEN